MKCFKSSFLTDLDRVELVDSWSEVVWISPECDVQWLQELVHTDEKILRPVLSTTINLHQEKLTQHDSIYCHMQPLNTCR